MPEPSHSPKGSSSVTLESNPSSATRRVRYRMFKKCKLYRTRLLELEKQNETLRKRVIRMRQTIKKVRSYNSPGTKAEIMIADPTKKEDVKKAIIFGDIVKANLKNDYVNQSKSEKRKLKENIEPVREKLKKYNLLQELPKITRKTNAKDKENTKKKQIDSDLQSFYEDDDNSRMTSGKKECITFNKQKKQKRFLNDTLLNLHNKFLKKHDYDVSYTYFCKAKPFWVITPAEKDRETCMCKLHENVDLLAKALHKNNIILQKSSNEILSASVCNIYNVQCLERKCGICVNRGPTVMEFEDSIDIEYYTWGSGVKEVPTKNGTRLINITEKKQHSGKPREVILLLLEILSKFYIHSANIVNQYECTTELKKEPESNSAVIHMDFSENYSTKFNTEIQSLHFGGSRTQISLHTSVIYVSGIDMPISFCTYSDCARHDATAVWGHIIPILKYIEKTAPETESLHFMTDSTCSQYRNKTMNFIITKLHWYLPKLKTITWNYSEAGHGKGAPDGVGATLKRTADQIVRYGKDIPDINTFADEIKKSVKNVILEYVSEYDIIEKEYLMPPQSLKPFKGTMQVHQIVWHKNNKDTIALRRQSCISDQCKNYAVACPHGKHLGFYSNPTEESNQPNSPKDIKVLSNVLLVPSYEDRSLLNFQNEFQQHMFQSTNSNVEDGEEAISCLSPHVAVIHRSKAFLAKSNAELPSGLQGNTSAKFEVQTPCLSPNACMTQEETSGKLEIIEKTQFLVDLNNYQPNVEDITCSSPNGTTDNMWHINYSDLLKLPDLALEAPDIVMLKTSPSVPFAAASIVTETSIPKLPDVTFEPPDIVMDETSTPFEVVPIVAESSISKLPDLTLKFPDTAMVETSPLVTFAAASIVTETSISKLPDVTFEPPDIVMDEKPFEVVLFVAETLKENGKGIADLLNESSVDPLGSETCEASSDMGAVSSAKLTESYENIEIGSWIVTLYQYQMKRNTGTKYYIGQVVNTNDDHTFTVKYLRRVKKTENVFSWPNKDDEDCVTKDDIVKILKDPDINRRGQLKFDDIENMTLE